MRVFPQLVWILLWLPSSLAVQNPPASPQGVPPAAHEPVSAEDRKKLNDSLLAAVERDDRSQIQELLAQGADPNAATSTG